MDIAALSMTVSQCNVQQQASMAILKKTMDNTSSEMASLLEGMPSAPPSGHVLDVRA